MNDLAEFLRARLRDDESLAQVIIDGDHWHGIHVDAATEVAVHIERHDPARVLREVEAKRETIRLYEDAVEFVEMAMTHARDAAGHEVAAESYLNVIRRDAAVYADHPDYREGWRP